MQMIMYAGEEYLTGDAIAEALLSYGRALGDNGRAELIEIPIREEDGSTANAKFLMGPASQIVVKTVSTDDAELEDAALVERLHRLAHGVESPTTTPVEAEDVVDLPGTGYDMWETDRYEEPTERSS